MQRIENRRGARGTPLFIVRYIDTHHADIVTAFAARRNGAYDMRRSAFGDMWKRWPDSRH